MIQEAKRIARQEVGTPGVLLIKEIFYPLQGEGICLGTMPL